MRCFATNYKVIQDKIYNFKEFVIKSTKCVHNSGKSKVSQRGGANP